MAGSEETNLKNNFTELGSWGFDAAGMDHDVSPGNNFYRFANGAWLKNTPIPDDEAIWHSMSILDLQAKQDLKIILETLNQAKPCQGSSEQKLRDYYQSFVNTDSIEARGLAPFEADLEKIAGLDSHMAVAKMAATPNLHLNFPILMSVSLDQKNPDRYSIEVCHGGLGLPIRDYYLEQTDKFLEIRKKYLEYIEQILDLSGYPDAAGAAQSILDLETQIAEIHWPLAKRRDRELTYNPKSQAELLDLGPEFPWEAMLQAMDLGKQDFFVVNELEAIEKLTALFLKVPVATWRAYLSFHYLNGHTHIMPQAFDDVAFNFKGRILSGQKKQRARWKRGVVSLTFGAAGSTLAEHLGKLYIEKHFTPETKSQVQEMVDNLLTTYRSRIEGLDWMSPETRRVALKKTQTVRCKIAYPDQWREHEGLNILPGKALENQKLIRDFEWQRKVGRLDKTTDREEWMMPAHAVNAYYNPVFNEIVFPAAILQAPFFDPKADAAVNYGSIGAIIGHEMGHGYDDQGAKSDEKGVLRTWWKREDEERFRKKTQALAKQFSTYSPLPGLKVNGEFTSGENIGDLGGLSVALAAYRLSLNGEEAPVKDGFTGIQRFFLGWAQVWRALIRDEAMRYLVTSDVHSPPPYRVNGIVRNMDDWYEAFQVGPDDELYLPPEERVRIW